MIIVSAVRVSNVTQAVVTRFFALIKTGDISKTINRKKFVYFLKLCQKVVIFLTISEIAETRKITHLYLIKANSSGTSQIPY